MRRLRRRARPMLGTLVAMRLDDVGEEEFVAATDAAFARVAEVHAAMSFHEPTSDLRALARAGTGSVVPVRADTWAVLRLALGIEASTGGDFNACCAAALVDRGVLPVPHDSLVSAATCLAEGIELIDRSRVRVLRTPWIDLGGIAKGYAVDAAVGVLRGAGVKSGVVNAGGDLFSFGPTTTTVNVRDPCRTAATHPVAEIEDLACATSASSLSPGAAHPAAHLVDRTRARDDDAPLSVTVLAPSCALADALTKHVWRRGASAASLLAGYGARAFVIPSHGSPYRF